MTNVFIDGKAGTTGLRIYERLSDRPDIHLILLPEEQRKNPAARREAIGSADIVFLCLPDVAAREAVALAAGTNARLIDTSTAHRVNPKWVYGFPEIGGRRAEIASAGKVANPGCHASGFVALVAPLVQEGLLAAEETLTAFSLTGYSGGGKSMIAEYEAPERSPLLAAPRQYGLTQQHKHLPEMAAVCRLQTAPAFCPIVAPYYSGMEVTVPLFAHQLRGTLADVAALYRDYYAEGLVRFCPSPEEGGFLSAGAMSGRDDMEITVQGNAERPLLVARFDNLGKGASGAAIQNMNLMLGLPESTGLVCE